MSRSGVDTESNDLLRFLYSDGISIAIQERNDPEPCSRCFTEPFDIVMALNIIVDRRHRENRFCERFARKESCLLSRNLCAYSTVSAGL